jgi:predicted acyltransferase
MPAPQTLATAPSSLGSHELPSERLLCLDVFRGLAVAGMILVDNPGSDDLAYGPIKHADWNGWTSADFIFPSFLFLVGISMVFSFAARLQRGESRKQILFHAFKRSLILIAIGLFVDASPIIGVDFHAWRFEGVTQRIALCYFAATILVLWSSRRGMWIAMCACLLGYWALLRFVPVPALECRDTASHSWTRIATSARGLIESCSWDIFSTEPGTLKEFSARSQPLLPP